MDNETRRLELSNKILQMGQALINEGSNNIDNSIIQGGTIMVLISGLLLNEQDMFIFSELCSMFSAKKILDAEEGIDQVENEMFIKILKDKKESKNTVKPEVKKRRNKKPKDNNPDEQK